MTAPHPVIDLVEAHREDLGFTIAEAAAKAGLDKNTVTNWRRGYRDPTLTSLAAYAGALGLAVTLVPAERRQARGAAL